MADAFLIASVSSAARPAAPNILGAVELATEAIGQALTECAVAPQAVDRLVLSGSLPSEPEDLALASAVATRAGIAPAAGSYGAALGGASGLLAVALAADAIEAGVSTLALAGGAEAPDRVPYWVPGLRRAPAEQATTVLDPLAAAAVDPRSGLHRDVEADGGDREAQDRFAVRSHERALAAGEITGRAPEVGTLAALMPIHSPDGTITTGNSPRLVAGAGVVLLSATPPSREPPVRISGWSLSGSRPEGTAATVAAAIGALAARLDREPGDLAAVEIHEDSAAFCLAAAAELGLDPEAINRRGGAIATGSPGSGSGPPMLERARAQLIEGQGPGAAIVAMAAPGGQALALALARD